MSEELLLLPKKYNKTKYKLVIIAYSGDSLDINFDSWKWTFRKKVSKYELKLPNGRSMLLLEDELYQVANKILEFQLNSCEVYIETLRIDRPFVGLDAFRSVKISEMGMRVIKNYPSGYLSPLSNNAFKKFYLLKQLNSSDVMGDVLKLKIDSFWIEEGYRDPSTFLRSMSFEKWIVRIYFERSRSQISLMDIVQRMLDRKPGIGCTVHLQLINTDITTFFDEIDSKLPEIEKVTYAGRVYRFIALGNADLVILSPARIYTIDTGHVVIQIDDGGIRKFGLLKGFFFRYYNFLAVCLKTFEIFLAISKKKSPNLPTESLCHYYNMMILKHPYVFVSIGYFILAGYILFLYIPSKLYRSEVPWGVFTIVPCHFLSIGIIRIFVSSWNSAFSYYNEPPLNIYF